MQIYMVPDKYCLLQYQELHVSHFVRLSYKQFKVTKSTIGSNDQATPGVLLSNMPMTDQFIF